MNVAYTVSPRWRHLLAGLLMLFAGASALANSAWFTRVWRTDEGLLNNTVTAVVQTGDGFLWVGTSAGLIRFDGAHFVEVPYLASGASADPNVRNLVTSRAGGLWIIPEVGPLICLNPDLSRASLPIEQLPKDNCIGLAEDRDGLWLCYAAGSMWRVKGGTVREYGTVDGVPAGTVNSLLTDSEGNVWLAKGGTVAVLRDDKFEQITTSREKIHLIPAGTNGVWIAAGFQVLHCSTNGTLREFGNIPQVTPTAIARTLIEDHNGRLWIGTDGGGLFYHNGTAFEPVEVSHTFVSCLMEDNEGNVWAGTLGGGLNRVFPSAVRLEGKEEGRSLVAIRSVCEGPDGMIWGATQNGDLVCRVNNAWTAPAITTFPNTTNMTGVDCITLHDGALWFGVRGRVTSWRDDKIRTWDTRGLGSQVTGMLSASNGDLWFCIYGRVNSAASVLRIRKETLETIKSPAIVGRRAVVAEDAAGKIWVGTASGQLFRMEGEEFQDVTALTSLSGRAIRNLHATPDGSLWIGYAGLGVGRIRDGKFARITSEQGLPENYISQIVSDGEGWVWFGGDRGIFKIRKDDLDAAMDQKTARVNAVLYGRNEGLYSQQTDATIWSGAIRSRDGRIWMPMRSALAVIDPGVRRERPRPPSVCLTRVSVDDRLVGTYGSPDGSREVANLKTLKSPLQLNPQHYKVEFDFSALNFAAPENVRFRYRLDGFDADWVDAGNQRDTRYSRLPAGEYHFRVAGCNTDGVWNELRLPVDLVVKPFFWQTGWFQLSVLLVFSSVLAGIVRYIFTRRLRVKLLAMEQQAALDRSRMAGMSEIAASVLHNVGNVLNSVNVSSTLVRDRLRHVKTANLANLHKAAALLNERSNDLPEFLANDPKGKQLPVYLSSLAQHLTDEQEEILRELSSLDENIDHIKEIVVNQQRYAQAAELLETFKPTDVVDDALRIHTGALEENQVQVVRDYQEVPPVITDKHKVLQILVTLVGNARRALETGNWENKRLVVRVGKNGGDRVVISVCDNGIGIPKENLTRIFHQGFAIAKSGEGMGLHSGANAARELGGSLAAQSDGPGTGATFTLEFPAGSRKPGGLEATANAGGSK